MRKTTAQREREQAEFNRLLASGLHLQATIYAAVDALILKLGQLDATPAMKQNILRNILSYIQSKIDELQEENER